MISALLADLNHDYIMHGADALLIEKYEPLFNQDYLRSVASSHENPFSNFISNIMLPIEHKTLLLNYVIPIEFVCNTILFDTLGTNTNAGELTNIIHNYTEDQLSYLYRHLNPDGESLLMRLIINKAPVSLVSIIYNDYKKYNIYVAINYGELDLYYPEYYDIFMGELAL